MLHFVKPVIQSSPERPVWEHCWLPVIKLLLCSCPLEEFPAEDLQHCRHPRSALILPFSGEENGLESVLVFVKQGGQRVGRGKSQRNRMYLGSPVSHFWEQIMFCGEMYRISVSCHKKEWGRKLFLMAVLQMDSSVVVQPWCAKDLRQTSQSKANLQGLLHLRSTDCSASKPCSKDQVWTVC